jgi:hypothetical protein
VGRKSENFCHSDRSRSECGEVEEPCVHCCATNFERVLRSRTPHPSPLFLIFGIIEVAKNREMIYGAQALAGKILMLKSLEVEIEGALSQNATIRFPRSVTASAMIARLKSVGQGWTSQRGNVENQESAVPWRGCGSRAHTLAAGLTHEDAGVRDAHVETAAPGCPAARKYQAAAARQELGQTRLSPVLRDVGKRQGAHRTVCLGLRFLFLHAGLWRDAGDEIPRKQLLNAVDGVVGDASQDFAQIGFGIEAVEFCRIDQAVDRRGAFPARKGSARCRSSAWRCW